MFLFKAKKADPKKIDENLKVNVDLEIITKMNQEFAVSLDLNETLMTALQVIIARINAQAANIFLINEKYFTYLYKGTDFWRFLSCNSTKLFNQIKKLKKHVQ